MKKSIIINQTNIAEVGPLVELNLVIPDGSFVLNDGTSVPLSNLDNPIDPLAVTALIDTGASDCVISDAIADRMCTAPLLSSLI